MKKFNIVKQDVILWEKFHLPINACYGRFEAIYKKRVGTKTITTKHGQVFEKPIYKTVEEEIFYYVDDFNPFRKNLSASKELVYEIHVYDKKRDEFYTTNTYAHRKYWGLGKFLAEMFEKNDIHPTTKCIPWIDFKTGRPNEKKAQCHADSVFRTNVGYALSKNVMTAHNINGDGWALYEVYGKTGGKGRALTV